MHTGLHGNTSRTADPSCPTSAAKGRRTSRRSRRRCDQSGVVAERCAEGIVVHYLLNGSVGIDNSADVALMVAVVVMVADSVTVERAVAALEKILRRLAVLKDEVAQVVGRV